MAKVEKPQVHAELEEQLHSKLLAYKSKRKGATKTSITVQALELYFALTSEDPRKDAALNHAIDTYFSVPRNIPHRAFYVFLYLLAEKLPEGSSKLFWSELVFKHSANLTNRKVFEMLKEKGRTYNE